MEGGSWSKEVPLRMLSFISLVRSYACVRRRLTVVLFTCTAMVAARSWCWKTACWSLTKQRGLEVL